MMDNVQKNFFVLIGKPRHDVIKLGERHSTVTALVEGCSNRRSFLFLPRKYRLHTFLPFEARVSVTTSLEMTVIIIARVQTFSGYDFEL